MPVQDADLEDSTEAVRIVVGIDGSRGARQALQRALELFGPSALFTLVNVVSPDAFPAERRAQTRLLSNTA